MGNEIATMTPAKLLEIAVSKDADLDKLKELMDLQERWEANEARKAYVQAMNDFKAEPPEIFKDTHVEYTTTKGTTIYDHANLANVVDAIGASLAKHSLSHRWNVEQPDGGQIKVICIITHSMGHSESVPMQSGADQSGGKNNIQAIGSTITYLERYTLLAATGMATRENNDDGSGSEPPALISEDQLQEIVELIAAKGADKEGFLKFLKLDSLDKLPASSFAGAYAALKAKK